MGAHAPSTPVVFGGPGQTLTHTTPDPRLYAVETPAAAADTAPGSGDTALPEVAAPTPAAIEPRSLTALGDPNAPVPLTLLVKGEADGFLEVWLPVRPNGSTGWVRSADVSTLDEDQQLIRQFLRGDAARLPSMAGRFETNELPQSPWARLPSHFT